MKNSYLKNVLFVCIVFSVILNVRSQNISNYTFTATSGTYTALSGSTAPSFSGGSTNDGWYNSIPIGFDFWFMGTRYDNVGASTNGWLTFGFGSTSISSAVAANSFSSNTVPKPFVAPLWDDLDFTQSLGVFSYKTTGSAPNRIFTAEWLNAEWGWSANNPVISFQVKLYETTGKIDFIYRQESSAVVSGTASIGVQGSSTFQSLNGAGSSPSSSTTTNTTNINAKPATGQVYSFTPPIPSAPTGVTFSSVTSSSMTLNWTDNATNEFGYIIYTSTDNTTFTFQTQLAANVTSVAMLSLSPATTYYYKIYAVTEGGFSNPLTGSKATLNGTLGGVITIPGNYATITAAITALQTNGFANSVILELQSSYSSAGETFPINLPSNLGTTATKTITLRPAAGVSNVTIGGNVYPYLININGCKYFTIDGRPGGTGTTKALTINDDNTATGYTLEFVNDASNDTIRYCNIIGNSASVIYIGTTNGTTGNDNNSIENCNIHSGVFASVSILISCGGITGKDNNSNTIANNNLYDFSGSFVANGINIGAGCTDFRITGNHIYETQSITATGSSYSMAGISFNNANGNITINNNYIGGSAPYCAGSAWELGSVSTSNQIFPINITSSTTLASTINGNTVSNFLLGTNSANNQFIGIGVNGLCTINGNTIGASTGTGNISVVSEYVGNALVYGIYAQGSTGNTISNNIIASFDVGGTLPAHALSFCGIQIQGGVNNISNNLIGSFTTLNSIIASNNSTAGQSVSGISSSSGGNIAGNTISNLTNMSTSAGNGNSLTGIYSGGTTSATGNMIQNLTSASSNALYGLQFATNIGISIISQNTIRNLYSTNTSAAAVIHGIYASGSSSGDTISRNFIHSFSIASSAPSAILNGIYLNSAEGGIVKNNMIQLGINPDGTSLTAPCAIYGINKQSFASASLLHNSIYIGGTGVAANSGGSACLYRNSPSSLTVYNNIFYNSRTNSVGGGNYHFEYVSNGGSGMNDYNLYYTGVPSACVIYTNGTLYTNFSTYKTATGIDANSGIADPRFIDCTGSSASVNLHINSTYATPIESFGSSTYTAIDDYDGQIRSSLTPVDVGADAGNFTKLTLPVKWLGFEGILENNKTVQLNWSTASEMNNDHFEVQRSVDGSQFTAIGKVKGNGNINSVSNYQFTDNILSTVNGEPPTFYYRLKQVDRDGSFEYSEIISVVLNKSKDEIRISPNPFTDEFTLLLPDNFNEDAVTVDIKDIQGRNVFAQTYPLQKDQVKISVETNMLNSGIYFANFITKNGITRYQKLIKQ